MITGEIGLISPASIAAGSPITIYVSFEAYYPGTYRGNHAEIIARSGNISGKEAFYSISEKLQRTQERVRLNGVMPSYPISISLTLRVREYQTPINYKWVTVDNKTTTIALPEELPAVTPLPPVTVDKKPWEFWKPEPGEPVVMPYPTTPTFEIPFETKTPEEKKQTWLWVGIAIVGVLALAFTLRGGM